MSSKTTKAELENTVTDLTNDLQNEMVRFKILGQDYKKLEQEFKDFKAEVSRRESLQYEQQEERDTSELRDTQVHFFTQGYRLGVEAATACFDENFGKG